MKKSTAVTLVISGALLAGCNRQPGGAGYTSASGTNQVYTNNTYVSGHGYWHAPYRDWYPYPWNFYRPGFGYYHGGFYSEQPQRSVINESSPRVSSYSGFHSSGSSWYGGSSGSSSGSSHSSSSGVSRGGFGGSAHGGGE